MLHNLASPETDLRGFFKGLLRASEEAAPVAEQQANYYTYLDTFFTEFARVTKSLEQATLGGPASLEQAIHSLPYQARLIDNATEFMNLLKPTAAGLVTVAPPLGHAFKEGAVNLPKAVALNTELAESSEALARFGQSPTVTLAFEAFTQTLEVGNPVLSGLAPSQAKCNYWTLAFRNVASLESQDVGVGTVARTAFLLAPGGPNNEGYPSSAPANGGSTEHTKGSTTIIDNNHLHVNPYPYVSAPGQRQVCEAGNQKFIPGQAVIGNVPAGSVRSGTEFTSRGNDLYGEPYPASTLKALGIKKGKS